ncbi:MAG: hypothetical protein K1W16_12840 [Lachnospiraceae bacterium]|jgi:hypothetical protein
MEESTTKRTISKSILFEKGGETISILVTVESASPSINRNAVVGELDILYADVKQAILS